VVIDTSTLISLARCGLLPLLSQLPVEPVILEVVYGEAVEAGLAGGHADAAAIEAAIAYLPRRSSDPGDLPDAAVLRAAREVGSLAANDLALGRRARNVGVNWLRTADLVVLLARTARMSTEEGRRAVGALKHAGRVSGDLADEYLAELM